MNLTDLYVSLEAGPDLASVRQVLDASIFAALGVSPSVLNDSGPSQAARAAAKKLAQGLGVTSYPNPYSPGPYSSMYVFEEVSSFGPSVLEKVEQQLLKKAEEAVQTASAGQGYPNYSQTAMCGCPQCTAAVSAPRSAGFSDFNKNRFRESAPAPTDAQILDALRRTHALIADPAHWRKGTWAATAEGERVSPTDILATQFCTGGALERIVITLGRSAALMRACVRELDQVAVTMLPYPYSYPFSYGAAMVNVNDQLGHAATMRMFGHAITGVERRIAEAAKLAAIAAEQAATTEARLKAQVAAPPAEKPSRLDTIFAALGQDSGLQQRGPKRIVGPNQVVMVWTEIQPSAPGMVINRRELRVAVDPARDTPKAADLDPVKRAVADGLATGVQSQVPAMAAAAKAAVAAGRPRSFVEVAQEIAAEAFRTIEGRIPLGVPDNQGNVLMPRSIRKFTRDPDGTIRFVNDQGVTVIRLDPDSPALMISANIPLQI